MNTELLKYLVELTDYSVDVINLPDLFKKFPDSSKTYHDLKNLRLSGYISILYCNDTISEIGINQKALDYFK